RTDPPLSADEKAQLVFPSRDALPGSGNGGKDRTRVLPGNSRFYIRYFMERSAQRGAGAAHGRGGIPVSTLICSFDGLHDNRVLRCCADFEANTLYMDTRTEAGETVSVRFTGLLAHWFENVIQDNILFGMDEIAVDGFFEQYKNLLDRTLH